MKALLEKIKKNNFTLGVIGIGRVGLPLALVFAQSGVRVIGIDKDEDFFTLKLREFVFGRDFPLMRRRRRHNTDKQNSIYHLLAFICLI